MKNTAAIPCPICRKPTAHEPFLRVQEMETRHWFDVLRCESCHTLRTWPVPEDLSPYYSGEIGTIMREKGGSLYESLKRFSLTMEFKRFQIPNETVTYLDVGCGSGDFSRLLHDKGNRVVSSDAAPDRPPRIQDISVIPYHPINFANYDIAGLSPVQNGYAIVRHVLEHLSDPRLFLEKMIGYGCRYVYIAVPNAASRSQKMFGQYWWGWDPPRHLWHFEQSSLASLLKGVGYQPLKWGCMPSTFVAASCYRYFRLTNGSRLMCRVFDPKGNASGLMGSFDTILGDSVLWITARLDR